MLIRDAPHNSNEAFTHGDGDGVAGWERFGQTGERISDRVTVQVHHLRKNFDFFPVSGHTFVSNTDRRAHIMSPA
jgi:hypothetical protein